MLKKAIVCLANLVDGSSKSPEILELSPDTYRVYFQNGTGAYKIRLENNRNNRRSLLHNEAHSLRLLGTYILDISHPYLLAIEQDSSGKLFSLQSYIPGDPITSIKSETKRYQYYTKVGSYLKHIHSISNSKCGRLTMLQDISWSDNFMNHFIVDSEEAKDFVSSLLMKDIYSQALGMLDSMASNPKLLHGDTHPGNMIISDSIAMIDFQHCLFGDPLFEVAQFYVRMSRHEIAPEKAMEALLTGLTLKELNIKMVQTYVLALFINEIAFSARISKKNRITFYKQKLLEFWNKTGRNM